MEEDLWGLIWRVQDGAIGRKRPTVAVIKALIENLTMGPWLSDECFPAEGGLRVALWCLGYEVDEAKRLARELVAMREARGLMVWKERDE